MTQGVAWFALLVTLLITWVLDPVILYGDKIFREK